MFARGISEAKAHCAIREQAARDRMPPTFAAKRESRLTGLSGELRKDVASSTGPLNQGGVGGSSHGFGAGNIGYGFAKNTGSA